jgi:hypothetical protein
MYVPYLPYIAFLSAFFPAALALAARGPRPLFVERNLPFILHTIPTMSVTEETNAVAPMAATVPVEIEPTKETQKAVGAGAAYVEGEEKDVKVSAARESRSRSVPACFFLTLTDLSIMEIHGR